MDPTNPYVRIHKPPTYYPGMGAYAHLQQQQLNMNSTYPKVNYTLPNTTRRKSHQNHIPPFNSSNTSNTNNNNSNHSNSNQYYPNQKSLAYSTQQGKQELKAPSLLQKFFNFNKLPKFSDIFKTHENHGKESKNSNGNDNLDGTYTICTGIPNGGQQQQQQPQQSQLTNFANNTRRFINVDKFLTLR